ncbi:UNVERIFIED_CONTAM: putative 6-phosphogluconolactonase 4, chloroplastic [Sesamum calycinum]|uniref:Probable 6-phosphogluconolactonase n=2 Tax=Sesamum TaxID=4181 RepID=A0AAW2LR09_9LAMI
MAKGGVKHCTVLPTEEDVAVNLARWVADLSAKTISEKGYFSVVLSGGTLINTLRKLTESPYKESVNWWRWLVFWADERVVPLDYPFSNYLLAWNGFLSKVPIPKTSTYHINYNASAEHVAKNYETLLRELVEDKFLPLSPTGFPQFDLMLLGIGPDGTVGSLFPNRPQRYDVTDWVTSIADSPEKPPKRITLTFPVINSATDIAVVVTDKEDADAVAITWEHIPVTPTLPCSELQAQRFTTWFLNYDAASKLPPNYKK